MTDDAPPVFTEPSDQERRAHEYANMILDQLRAARTPGEAALVSRRHEAAFARLQAVVPVRARHIVALAEIKRREFENEPKTISASRARRRVEPHSDQQGTLFD